MIYDKWKSLIENKDEVLIELGPGEKKYKNECIGIDKVKKNSVDICYDFEKGFPFIENESIDIIYAFHVFEHIDNIELLFNEMYRILKSKGGIEFSVPHFSNPYFYSDYTHNKFWGLYTVEYFSKNKFFKRDVPKYYNNINFKIKDVELIFKSPFRFRNTIKKILTKIINSTTYIQEFYEENLCYLFPCYEIYIRIYK